MNSWIFIFWGVFIFWKYQIYGMMSDLQAAPHISSHVSLSYVYFKMTVDIMVLNIKCEIICMWNICLLITLRFFFLWDYNFSWLKVCVQNKMRTRCGCSMAWIITYKRWTVFPILTTRGSNNANKEIHFRTQCLLFHFYFLSPVESHFQQVEKYIMNFFYLFLIAAVWILR